MFFLLTINECINKTKKCLNDRKNKILCVLNEFVKCNYTTTKYCTTIQNTSLRVLYKIKTKTSI